MQTKEINEKYLQYQGMIYKVAQKRWTMYGGEFEEYQEEANLLFVELCHKYDKEQYPDFFKYIHSKLYDELQKYGRNVKKKESNEIKEIGEISFYETKKELPEKMSSISDLAKQVIAIVFNPSMLKHADAQKQRRKPLSRYKIEQYLCKEKGMKRIPVRKAFWEIQGAL